MSTVVADLIARLRADTSQFNSAMRGATATAQTTNKGVTSSMVGMYKGMAAAAATYGVANFLKGSIAEAEEAQRVAAQTVAVLKSTGGVAGVTKRQVDKYATSIGKLAAIDDEQVQASENMLLTFKNIGKELFGRTTKAIVNTAAGYARLHNTTIDLSSATIAIGKAMNDPISGLTALRRVGIQFSDSQVETIKNMVAFGNNVGAQKIILSELESQFGGSAAAGVTASQRLSVSWNDLKEQVGTLLMPVFQSLVSVLSDIFAWIGKNKDYAIPALGAAFVAFMFAVNPVLGALSAIVGYLMIIEKYGDRMNRLFGGDAGRKPFNPNYSDEHPYVPPAGTPKHPSGVYVGATGGYKSGLTLVGERGPEFVSLPAGSFVHPNLKSMAMAGAMGSGGGWTGGSGTTVQVFVSGSVVTERQLTDVIHEGLLKKKRQGGSLGLT